jgi:transposase
MCSALPLERIGVGIDTARYGHRVSFLRPDRRPAAKALTVTEDRAGYDRLHERLKQLHAQHPQAHLFIRIDAAGQYAINLEHFLRGLDLPMTISIGEPKRNKDYRKAHFPKRTTDDTESQAMARFAVVEQPQGTPPPCQRMLLLREIVGRLQSQVKQSTRAINRLHNLLARTFPELAQVTDDFSAGWLLRLLARFPTAERIAGARTGSLERIPHITPELAGVIREAAHTSVGSLRGPTAEILVRSLVMEVRLSLKAEAKLRELLTATFDELPASAHRQVLTILGIGHATAAILVAKIVDIDRFATADKLVGYFGVFPEEHSSGVDKKGNPLSPGTLHISKKGCDLARGHLWNAALTAIRCNPAVRPLYARLKAKGKRGDVALGHCMRKLLHLVFAVWKTDRPFDPNHFPWGDPTGAARPSENEKAVGHKQDSPAKEVVTTATPTVAPKPDQVKPAIRKELSRRPRVDFGFVRQQVTMEQVLDQLGLRDRFRGRGSQRRGPCPIHSKPGNSKPTFSVDLHKKVFQCFHAQCAAKGNVLDLWSLMHQLPLYEAALHLCETFQLAVNREEEHVINSQSLDT